MPALAFAPWSRSVVGDAVGTDVSPQILARNIIHQLGIDLRVDPQIVSVDVHPSMFPTRVVVHSEVKTDGVQRFRSPEFMATVRRRETRALSNEIMLLASHSGRDDFAVSMFPVTERIKKLLATLAMAEREGNTREILRRIRDSMQNGGWENYRKAQVRDAVASILTNLAELEEVQPGHVKICSDKLAAIGLDPIAHLFDIGDRK